MLARQKFQKALMLLDRGALDRGEVTLREVVAESASEGDTIALVQGLVCLGELLHASGRFAEARLLLARALQEKRDDDLLAQEFERAKALLSTSSSSLPYAMQLQRRRRNGARFGKVFGLIRLRTGTRDSDP